MASARLRSLHPLTPFLLFRRGSSLGERAPRLGLRHRAVLQRDRPIAFWGFADQGEEVTVSLAGRPAKATAAADGRFRVVLDALPAGGPHELVAQGRNRVVSADVLVGELWLCAGQSNMAMTVGSSRDAEKEAAASDLPSLRVFTVATRAATEPEADVRGTWVAALSSGCDPHRGRIPRVTHHRDERQQGGRGGTIVCPACGGAAPKTAQACPYCGAEIVLPKPLGATGPAERRTYCARCGTLYAVGGARCLRCPPGQTDEKGGFCPRCASHLEATSIGGVTVDTCPSCRGHWFDGDEMEHVADLTTEGISREDAARLRTALPAPTGPVEEVRYVACVRCGEMMARRQVAPKAGIIVDVCRYHGVWFDGGEWEHFQKFVKAGGLEVLRHDGVAAVELRRKKAAALPDPTWTGRRRPSDPLGDVSLRALLRLFWGR